MNRALKQINANGLDCTAVIRQSEHSLEKLFEAAGLDRENDDNWRGLLAVLASILFTKAERGRPSNRVGDEIELLRRVAQVLEKDPVANWRKVIRQLKKYPNYENMQEAALKKKINVTATVYGHKCKQPPFTTHLLPSYDVYSNADNLREELIRDLLSNIRLQRSCGRKSCRSME